MFLYAIAALFLTGGSCDGGGGGEGTGGIGIYELAVSFLGTGSGAVTINPGGIICRIGCLNEFGKNAMVTLTAAPDADSTFEGWLGECAGTGPCAVTLTTSKSVSATFVLKYFQVSVSKSGAGEGTVTSSPAGINCGSRCSAGSPAGTTLTLTAVPNGVSTFGGWSGTCAGIGNCVFQIDTTKEATANFGLLNFSLIVSKFGNGTVATNPGGIDCGTDCAETFAGGTQVQLIALPDSGWQFAGWSGNSDCADGTLDMMGDRGCTANFVVIPPNQFALTVSKSGNGTVTSSPPGINCGSDCSEFYGIGSTVALSASADAGWQFAGWGGDADCTDGYVTMSISRYCLATFIQGGPGTSLLTIAKSGNGRVMSNPQGIDCGADCSEVYSNGTVVMLTATPDPGWQFGGWTSDSDCGDGQVTMDAGKSCTATFTGAGGEVQTWVRTYDRPMQDYASSVKATPDGGFIVAGVSSHYIDNYGGEYTDIWILKLDAGGNVLWERTLGNSWSNQKISVIIDPNGGYLVGGALEG
ncbi:MAG: InlB B-repeat-containing protein, partial [bacterium]